MAVNYVKFMRGTQALYNSLVTKDNDTLYFVYESASSETGKLYLGNKLISGSSENPSGEISTSQIRDFAIDSITLEDGQILVYDEAEGKWVNQTIAEAFNIPVMTGATENADGASGLVPVPSAGDNLKFLRGDGTWAEVDTSELNQSISDLESTVATLVGTHENESVDDIVAAKVAELLIPENAQESLDTLQEIADWIQSHPNDVATINSDISDLQTRVGNLETTVGTFTPVADKYLDVSSAITYLDNSMDTLDGKVSEIDERLKWHELSA